MPLAVCRVRRLSALRLRPWICRALARNVPPCQPNACWVSSCTAIWVRPSYSKPCLTPPVTLPSTSLVSDNANEMPYWLRRRAGPTCRRAGIGCAISRSEIRTARARPRLRTVQRLRVPTGQRVGAAPHRPAAPTSSAARPAAESARPNRGGVSARGEAATPRVQSEGLDIKCDRSNRDRGRPAGPPAGGAGEPCSAPRLRVTRKANQNELQFLPTRHAVPIPPGARRPAAAGRSLPWTEVLARRSRPESVSGKSPGRAGFPLRP